MQLKLLTVALTMLMVCSCETKPDDSSLSSLFPGTYARSFGSTYARGNDTLMITKPDAAKNYFVIVHAMSYEKMHDGRLVPREYKTETWIAVFDATKQVLVEQKNGKLLSLIPAENALLIGNNKYYKTN